MTVARLRLAASLRLGHGVLTAGFGEAGFRPHSAPDPGPLTRETR